MPRPRINLRLSPDMHARLKQLASPRGVTISQIVEEALEGFLDPFGAPRHASGVYARLERMERQFGEFEKDLAVTSETIALFARYWLTATPPLPEIDRDAAHALGQKRFERFMSQVARAVARDPA